MKIKIKHVPYSYIENIKQPKRKKPLKPFWLLGAVIRLISIPDLFATRFKFTKVDMEKAGKGPYLILMNHSSFLDLKIAYRIFFPKSFATVCTTDALVGKKWLMRLLGCIPTNKFVTDISLISDMLYSVKKNNTSVLMFPEAGYSFDGRATEIPKKLGVLLKKMDVPLITVITDGAFLRDPLYNGLQLRKVKVTAEVKCLLSREEIAAADPDEISRLIEDTFTFDGFKNQLESKTEIKESFRADGLERILYKCPNCQSEEHMKGKGIHLTCHNCQKMWEMDTLGRLHATKGDTEFSHIPDWYDWERAAVKKEIEDGKYLLDTNVKIGVLADSKALYMIGEGRLTHTKEGFTLTGCNGELNYTQGPKASYTLNSDFFWYEIGDVICIGDKKRLYYCFPQDNTNVAKARLATEEIYKQKGELQ